MKKVDLKLKMEAETIQKNAARRNGRTGRRKQFILTKDYGFI
jgi:hypothetical protein